MAVNQARAPSISVIIPVYNAAAHLKSCLDAVAGSNYPSYECIVVNDGSTDGCQSIAAQFPVEVLNLHDGPFGPAHARNQGAKIARGTILFFVDADIILAPGALKRVSDTFRDHPNRVAVFGSYDARPAAPGVISQYRNLLHHFVHQNGNTDASTFWAGCGAISRSVFEEVGGFDEKQFARPAIEDIELGYRLRNAGHRILLDKGLQGTHLKHWSLCSMIRTDIMCRAIPWSRLIQQAPKATADLNLQPAQKASVVLVGLACVFLALAVAWPQALAVALLAIAGVIFLNLDLYAFFRRRRGLFFAAACLPLHMLYYLYSGFSYIYVWSASRLKRAAAFWSVRGAGRAGHILKSRKS